MCDSCFDAQELGGGSTCDSCLDKRKPDDRLLQVGVKGAWRRSETVDFSFSFWTCSSNTRDYPFLSHFLTLKLAPFPMNLRAVRLDVDSVELARLPAHSPEYHLHDFYLGMHEILKPSTLKSSNPQPSSPQPKTQIPSSEGPRLPARMPWIANLFPDDFQTPDPQNRFVDAGDS